MKWKKSRCNKLHFFTFSSVMPSNSESGWSGSTCKDARWGLASLFTTSWNCLKYPLFHAYAKKSSLYQFISMIFDGKSMTLYFVITTASSQIGHFSSALSSDTKSVTRIYFLNFAISTSKREIKTFPLWEDFRANVLKRTFKPRIEEWTTP